MASKEKKKIVWLGNELLRPSLVEIDTIQLDSGNARRHTPRSLKGIAASLKQFGQQTPIVIDKERIIRKGNGTTVAARDTLEWTHIAAVMTNIEGNKLKIYSLGDNRTGELSVWDAGVLAENVQTLFQEIPEEVWTSWWQDYELQPLMDAELWTPPKAEGDSKAGGKDDPLFSGKKGAPIAVTGEQRLTIDRAVAQIRAAQADPEMSEGRCLELIAADYLSGS